MGITGVGSSYNFVYNTKTGKLSTKDGSKNEFVDFCNGDVKGEDTETLNHFDEHTRYQFTRMLFAYGTGMTGQNPFANDEKVEITADIDSATHTSFYVNGRKRLRQLRVCHISHPRFKPLEPYSSHLKPEGTNHMIPVQTVSRLGLEADLILEMDTA